MPIDALQAVAVLAGFIAVFGAFCAVSNFFEVRRRGRDSRAYALGPARNRYGLPVAGEAVNDPRGDVSKGFHSPNKR